MLPLPFHRLTYIVREACITPRRLFSKIISDANYKPSCDVAIALDLALHLSLEDLKDLLERAGYTLSKSSRRDLIIEYFFTNQTYDILLLNTILHNLGEPLL